MAAGATRNAAGLAAIEVARASKIYRRYSHRKQFATLKSALLTRSLIGSLRPDETFTALNDVSLTVPKGRTLGVIGRNGSGKSTLLKLVNRLLLPDAGSVFVLGRDTREWEPIALRRSIGYVLQDVGLFPHMSVAANVAVVPRLERWNADRIAPRVDELLDLVGLPPAEFGNRWPDELSGGQRQRVGVARALAVDPPVLLMDEPFGALDPLTRAELHAEFRRIQSRLRKTVIIVTHDMGEAFALADRVGVLEEGRLIANERAATVAASTDPRVRRLLDAVPAIPRDWGARAQP